MGLQVAWDRGLRESPGRVNSVRQIKVLGGYSIVYSYFCSPLRNSVFFFTFLDYEFMFEEVGFILGNLGCVFKKT